MHADEQALMRHAPEADERPGESDSTDPGKIFGIALVVAALALIALFFSGGGTSSKPQAQSQSQAQQKVVVNRAQTPITVLTGPTSGLYYPIGNAFSKVLSDMGYKATATATGASRENINAVLTGKGDLGIAMMDSVIMAMRGEGAWKGSPKATDLRAVMGLWPNVVQIITTEDAGIRSFADLRGKRVSVGQPNSGMEVNARMIFEAHDMSYQDIDVDFTAYGEAIDKMIRGKLDAAFVTSGLGNATLMKLAEVKKIAFVPVEGEALQRLSKKSPVLVEGSIPPEVYGTDAPTTTAVVMNVMLASKKLPDDVVYDILDGIYSRQGLETIGASHPIVAKEIQFPSALRGIQGTDLQLHPGAEKFYRERGLLK